MSTGPPLLLLLQTQERPRGRRIVQTISISTTPLRRYEVFYIPARNSLRGHIQASLDMMTGSATTEELHHSATPYPRPSHPHPAQGSPPPSPSHLLPLPSTPLLSGRRSPSLRVCGQEMAKPGSLAIALVADAAIDGDSVNSNSAVILTSSSCPNTETTLPSKAINATTSLSETTALVVRHSSCDPGAPTALI